MGTRSIIAIRNDSGIDAIYCHWDGYPSHNGYLLLNFYNTAAKAEALIGLGSLSSLNANLEPPAGARHSFEERCRDVTVAYHRDRNEPWENTHPHHYATADELYADRDSYGAEYIYLFTDGAWQWTPAYEDCPHWKTLTALDCVEDVSPQG